MSVRPANERKARARHPKAEQLPLFTPPKPRGGRRRGAGRPPKGQRTGSPHIERPALASRFPVHVVLRVVEAIGNLRRRRAYHAIRAATYTVGARADFHIVHLSIQRTHVHLIVEAHDKLALARGMQAFQISAAKHLNRAIRQDRPGPRRRGNVFPDRYHAEIIKSPWQARHTLAYVMNNWRKHGEDRAGRMQAWKIDWFLRGGLQTLELLAHCRPLEQLDRAECRGCPSCPVEARCVWQRIGKEIRASFRNPPRSPRPGRS